MFKFWLRCMFISMAFSQIFFVPEKPYASEQNSDPGLLTTTLPELMKLLFDNPTNLELNFMVMQAQMAEGNLEAAEATLERVLILDPSSTLARILIAEIRIKLGKLSSARLVLDELIEDETTSPQTRARAEEFVEQINDTISTRRFKGGVSVFAGQTENAFGRSKDDEILIFNLPINNATKNKSDQVYGYQAYYRMVQELDYQVPTVLDAGVNFNSRETHDPALSDLHTVSADISISRAGKFQFSSGVFSSYTDVNKQDFNRRLGVFMSASMPLFNYVQLTNTVTATRSIFMPYSAVVNNAGKSNRSYTEKLDITRPTGFGYLRLGLSAGTTKAEQRLNNFRFEKVQLDVVALLGNLSLSSSLSRQWTRYNQADIFVSTERQKSAIDQATLSLKILDNDPLRSTRVQPYLNLTASETESNIPNYRRNSGEVALGLEVAF